MRSFLYPFVGILYILCSLDPTGVVAESTAATVGTFFTTPTMTVTKVTGNIVACEGAASASPSLLQFAVSGTGLSSEVKINAPAGFEVSLGASNGYVSVLTLTPINSGIGNTVVFVRSAATASQGVVSGLIIVSTSGSADVEISVRGIIRPVPTVDPVADQLISNNTQTSPVTFSGTGNEFAWFNDTPSIGLPASGTGNINTFTAANPGSGPITATITATPTLSGYAYVTNYSDNTVSVVSIARQEVVATIPVQKYPLAVSVSPDGSRAYVANNAVGTVSVIKTSTNAVISTITIGETLFSIAVSADGGQIYVGGNASFFCVDPSTGAIIARIPIAGGVSGICAGADVDRAYVTDQTVGKMMVIDPLRGLVLNNIAVGNSPTGLTMSHDGSKLYVVNSGSNNVAVVSTASNSVTSNITLSDNNTSGIAISPDDTRLYVAGANATLSVVSTVSQTVISTVSLPTGTSPFGLSFTSDGSKVYVADRRPSGSVMVINTATNSVSSVIPTGGSSMAFGNFITSGSNCTGTPVTFRITVTPSVKLHIDDNLAALSSVYGTASSSTSFVAKADNLVTPLVITPPPGFEVSIDNASFCLSSAISPPGGVAAKIYVRLSNNAPVGAHSGPTVLSTNGMPDAKLDMPSSSVSPAPLTITADNKRKVYNEDNPVLTYTYKGFVNNEDASQLLSTPAISTTAAKSSPPGRYPITLNGGTAANYSISRIDGVLTIAIESKQALIPTAFTPNGDSINDLWNIAFLQDYPKCRVDVYNRNGQHVFFSTGYKRPWNGTYQGAPVPVGVYYYIITLSDNGERLKGAVTIIR